MTPTGARYVMDCVRIRGLEAFADVFRIPLKHGADQCVGGTICAGGILHGQRGIAAMMEFARDIREVCQTDALLLNCANPMAVMTSTTIDFGHVRLVGLCRGVRNGHRRIARAPGVPMEVVDIVRSGMNHRTWYLDIRHQGRTIATEDLVTPFEAHPVFSRHEKVRIDMLKRYGFIPPRATATCRNACAVSASGPRRPPTGSAWTNGPTARPADIRAAVPKTGTGSRRISRNLSWTPALRRPVRAPSSTRNRSSRRWRRAGRSRPFKLKSGGIVTNRPEDCAVDSP